MACNTVVSAEEIRVLKSALEEDTTRDPFVHIDAEPSLLPSQRDSTSSAARPAAPLKLSPVPTPPTSKSTHHAAPIVTEVVKEGRQTVAVAAAAAADRSNLSSSSSSTSSSASATGNGTGNRAGETLRLVEPRTVPLAKSAIKKEEAKASINKEKKEAKKSTAAATPAPPPPSQRLSAQNVATAAREAELATRKKVQQKGEELKKGLEKRSQLAKRRAAELEKETRSVVRRYPVAASGIVGACTLSLSLVALLCMMMRNEHSHCFDASVNLAILGSVGYMAYSHWHLPRWDRKVVSSVSIGLAALAAGQGSVVSFSHSCPSMENGG